MLGELGKDPFGNPGSSDPADYKAVPGMEEADHDTSTLDAVRVGVYAYQALDALGIEPKPYAPEERLIYLAVEDRWKQWWEEVKSGKRHYRFKGSDVLHPVNAPPGTGREIRRPERTAAPDARPPLGSPASGRSEAKGDQVSRWPLFAGSGALLLAATLALVKKRGRGKDPGRG